MTQVSSSPFRSFFFVALWAAATACASAQVVYNLTNDWSDVNNPNGVWRIFKAPGQLFAINQSDYWADSTNQRAWADQPFQQTAHVPVWMKLTAPITGFASTGSVVMHTAETGRTGTELSSVTWTSPGAGQISISGSTWLIKVEDRPQVWRLLVNGSSISFGTLLFADSFTESSPYNFVNGSGGAGALSRSVQAGDIVELQFFRQSTSTAGYFVGVNLGVSFTAIPEPGASALASGLIGLAVARGWRRRIRSS